MGLTLVIWSLLPLFNQPIRSLMSDLAGEIKNASVIGYVEQYNLVIEC